MSRTKRGQVSTATSTNPAGEMREIKVQLRGSSAPIPLFCATGYTVRIAAEAVYIDFHATASGARGITQVVIPIDILGRTVLRERSKLRGVMRTWQAKNADPSPGEVTVASATHVAANFASVGISEFGGTVMFHWLSPLALAKNGPVSIEAAPVLEVRLPSAILARLWLELDTYLGGESTDAEGPELDADPDQQEPPSA